MDRMRKHFKDTQAGPISKAGKEQLKTQLKDQMKGQEISDVMLEQMQGVQMVQPVALVPGGPHNGFVHTNLYVDDRHASLKHD